MRDVKVSISSVHYGLTIFSHCAMLVDLVVTEFQIPQDLPEDGTYYSVGVGLDVASRACGTSILICESYYTPSCLMVNSAE